MTRLQKMDTEDNSKIRKCSVISGLPIVSAAIHVHLPDKLQCDRKFWLLLAHFIHFCILINVNTLMYFSGNRFSGTDVCSGALLLTFHSNIRLFAVNETLGWYSAGVRSANRSGVVFTIALKSAVVGGDIVFLTINNYLKACCQNSHERVMKMQTETSLCRILILQASLSVSQHVSDCHIAAKHKCKC